MSQFSNRLKMLLDESGTNVYQLSRNARLDRTTIQRALKGERLPSTSFIEKLCDYLRVSPAQRSELLELYTVSRVGEKVYADREYIKDMIERMAAIHNRPNSSFVGQRTIEIIQQIGNSFKTISGKFNVQNLLRDILEDEVLNGVSPYIYLTVPFENTFLFDLLYHLFLSSNNQGNNQRNDKRFIVKHIIKLSKNPHSLKDSNYNLKILSNVLPFAFCEWGTYEPYYYYGNVEDSGNIDSVLPYYILTSKYLIKLSSDFNAAVIYSNNEIFDIYRDSFKKSLLETSPLIKILGLCEDMLMAYLTAYNDAGQFTHIIEPQPCFARYYTDQFIEDNLRKDLENRELLKTLVNQLYAKYKHIDKSYMSFFSVEGIEYFVKTGMLADLPPQYALPFTIKYRKMLLEQLRNDIYNDNYFARAVKSSRFIVSPLATFELHGTDVLMIVTINNSGIMSTSFIKEKSICEAFFDFFNSLPEGNLLLSKEETIRVIDEAITQLAAI